MQNETTFDPSRYLSSVSGNSYLEVKWRLVWFREKFPAGKIETNALQISDQIAIMHARVTAISQDGEIVGSADGTGSEVPSDFRDFVEKAETKAIGRALAGLGFGTQFAEEFADSEGASRPAAPVERRGVAPSRPVSQRSHHATNRVPERNHGAEASAKQLGKLGAMARERGLSDADLDDFAIAQVGQPVAQLTRGTASTLIERLGAAAPGGSPAAQPKRPGQPARPANGQSNGNGQDHNYVTDVESALAAWEKNIRTAHSLASLAIITHSLEENGLRHQPRLVALLTERDAELREPAVNL